MAAWRRRNCVVVFFAMSTALFCLLNIYKSGIIQVHMASLEASSRRLPDAHLGILHAGHIMPQVWPKAHSLAVTNQSQAHKESHEGQESKDVGISEQSQNLIISKGNSSSSYRSESTIYQVKRPPDQEAKTDTEKSPSNLKRNQYSYVPLWQLRLKDRLARGQERNDNGTYFLAELLQVRVYEDDKAKWTIRELKQWIHYMFLAGVEHIYLCDHYKFEYEKLDVPLKRYIDAGLVTYFPWSAVRHPMTAQLKCYQKMIDEYKTKHTWQIAVDMDEYPFSSIDTREGFLVRYLLNTTASFPNPRALTEISMNNYLMLGQGDRTKDMVIDRLNRMTPKPANVLVKPIYKPQRVRANLHHNILQGGRGIVARDNELRMLHYWGARTQDWGPDTEKTLSITTPMNKMREAWAPQVRNSLLAFGEDDAFSASTGP